MAKRWSSSSFFGALRARELHGFRVRKSPFLGDLTSESGGFGTGVVSVEHDGATTPPLAVSFGKTSGGSHLLAVSDEDGYVSFFDTRRRLPSSASCRERTGEARIHDWVAHNNAIFDVCWIKDDTQILTASGDQTIKIWSVERRKCIGILTGHTGSVKSLCSHSSNPELVVSGSRDGSFALWDLRCKPSSTNGRGEARILCAALVKDAHASPRRLGLRRRKAPSMSITSVLCLKDEVSVASAGAVDSVVKFWDTRNLRSSITQTCPCSKLSPGKEVQHGISSLSQDASGVFLSASCMDDRIYLYDMLHLVKGPIKIFAGSKIESFYVKSAISPDGAHILSGSSDGNAYIWRVGKPEGIPVALKGHEGEVTAVDWCSSEFGKIATSSDDFTVRVWNIGKGACINTRSPTAIRKRIIAAPSIECRKLVMDEPLTGSVGIVSSICHLNDVSVNQPSPVQSKDVAVDPRSPIQSKVLEFSTPDSVKKRKLGSFLNEEQEMQKSPEVASNSPSSVLNPPSSLKRRTIRDYFLATS